MPGPASFFGFYSFLVTPVSNTNSFSVAIGLGSNLGDRSENLRQAMTALHRAAQISVVVVAEPLETEPVGMLEQPRFLNTAALLHTTLSPLSLLQTCQAIERSLGRDRAVEQRWGPRTIDLDILLFAHQVISVPGLIVPHPRMLERGFVLGPLASIAPELVIPESGLSVRKALERLNHSASGAS